MDCYMHIVPGRIRVRTSALRRNEIGLFSLNKFIKDIEGVTSIQCNSRLGSVLILYDRNYPLSEVILDKMALHGFVPHINWRNRSINAGASISNLLFSVSQH